MKSKIILIRQVNAFPQCNKAPFVPALKDKYMEYEINQNFNIDIELLKARVDALAILNDEQNINASELLAEVNNLLLKVTGRRDEVISEYEKRIDETRADYKPYINLLQQLKDRIKSVMLAYKKAAKLKISQAKSDIKDGIIERSETMLDEKGNIINAAALTVRTKQGLSAIRRKTTIKITDISLVPDAFKIVDKTLIRQAIKNGNKNIPGVEITESEDIMVNRKAEAA